MIKYVVWGAGHRGKRLQRFLKDRIIAFIDKDFKNLVELNGAPVISFNDYLEKYYGYPIVISPLYIDEISAELAPYPDIPIIKTVQEISEISFGLPIPFDKLNLSRFAKDKQLYLYGINLFSLVLHEYLENDGWKNLTFLPGNTGINFEQAKTLGLNVSDKADRKSIILCAEKDIEKATLTYPANRTEDFWNLSMQTKEYNHPELKRFHNIHKGQRLFLIATGPSLKIEDLDKLYANHELTMSVNMVYRCFDRTKWRPDYYVFNDIHGLKQYEDEIRNLDLPCMFLSDVGVEGWVSKELKENMNVCHLISDRLNGWPRISSEISKFISGGVSVMSSGLQIALYMGFKEIYLLGADCDYKGAPQDEGNHFIEGYCKKEDKQPRIPYPITETFICYQAIRHYATMRGVKIYNATRGGKLEVFERVDFDSLF